MEEDIPFIVTEPIKEALPKPTVNLFCQGSHLHGQIPTFMLQLRNAWSNKGKMSKMKSATAHVDGAQPLTLNDMNFHRISMEDHLTSIIDDCDLSICGSRAAVFADTEATHSVTGGKRYHFLKKRA
ncbi:hypothetical protein CEXT_611621 [Caerostris extrusa]|uniref:Uncharacterized protein n=1 Tax=Caerostris extrusa TaxID=172846 RepID=A0AAV4MFX3_CAEEX|nr:hypothetical protein CEXT_611621 [Caerostris extrusa]